MQTNEQQAANDWSVADVIIISTPHLPDAYKARFLARTKTMRDSGARMAALISLASVLSEPERTVACEEAFAIAQQMENPWVRVRSLSEVYDVLPPTYKDRFLETALTAVEQITNEWHKRRAMVPLARHLSDEQATRAAEMARAISDSFTRTEVLARYARVLPEEEREAEFQQIPAMLDESARVSTMLAFLPHLPAGAKSLALTWLPALTQPAPRIQALLGLGEHFPEHKPAFVQEAFGYAQAMDDEMERMYALLGLLRHMPEPDKAATLAQLREVVERIEEASFKAGPMISLARYTAEEEKPAVWQEVLATVRQIEGYRRAIMLSLLLGDLPEEARPGILDEILAGI